MLIFYLVIGFFNAEAQGLNNPLYCAKSNAQNQDVENVASQEVCKKGTNTCYAWAKKDSDNSSINWTRGCWGTSGDRDCSSPTCQPQYHPSKATVLFCCCSGDMCNFNITINGTINEYTKEREDSNSKPPMTAIRSDGNEWKAVIGGSIGFLFITILAVLACMWAPSKEKKTIKEVKSHRMEQANNIYSMSHLTLDRIVGQGRYGTVWLGHVRDQQVAIKMFPMHYSQYFYNEKDIYILPHMEHPGLLTYYGSDEMQNEDGVNSLVLVLSYCHLGTLQEYLKGHTIDFDTFLRMTLSFTSALAYLHTEINKNGEWKPCITHRDVNTRNILVKEDKTCCLADLGLAVKITGSHYYTLGEEQHAETKSINDVGTLRYMAPEVLEGAVNLRDCESSLKQIDVYALGLVLWELTMRVVDFYNKPTDVPSYVMPFEKEIGLHPTFEEMQSFVCRNKARPLFPREWKNSIATRTLRETIEDCTDQDGEARLTSLCVHERISQLYKGSIQGGGVSPTLNQTNMPIHNYNNNNNIKLEALDLDKEIDGTSEGTVETLITLSPSESYNTQLSTRETMIQPHQGRNPCLERNLFSSGSEEICIVQTSSKHKKVDEEVECLVTSRPQVHQAAIPYVHNMPFSGTKQVNVPKQQPGIVASLMNFIRKKEDPDTSLTHVIVSPFESGRRPSSLLLLPVEKDEPEEDEDKRLKELSGRIRTPGDIPASVRKKRGSRARLSLYDDRIMSNSALDSTF